MPGLKDFFKTMAESAEFIADVKTAAQNPQGASQDLQVASVFHALSGNTERAAGTTLASSYLSTFHTPTKIPEGDPEEIQKNFFDEEENKRKRSFCVIL